MRNITVLVPTLGSREEKIYRLLRSLKDQIYKNFEVVFISQDNHFRLEKIIEEFTDIEITQLKLNEKGLSKARNAGLEIAQGNIIVLSDDDCWYPRDALKKIVNIFRKESSVKFVLTQIYDKESECLYKSYSKQKGYIHNKIQLMSKSSIEIAFKKDKVKYKEFDERFGLGAKFVCGEEIDFLINNFEKKKYVYVPVITVYHLRKSKKDSKEHIIAKGALYAKNYCKIVCIMVLLKDLFMKKECNFKNFFEGYIGLKRMK